MIGITTGFRLSYTQHNAQDSQGEMSSNLRKLTTRYKEFSMNRSQVFFGTFLLMIGGVLLLENVLHVSAWAVCCPVMLIAFGFALLVPSRRRTSTIWYSDDTRIVTPSSDQKF